ncbi:hypothetical protein HL653_23390 [Sphingomonas sp. AP4-R1]|uniref:hypothetical protein n=1 Tax=Sphingomonas sp. AP4-R1 TaxID=2735134 RepID=UPI001493A3FC|nr:hypothetical protein [Sphingomonas sp. AP4-R1]QJU60288.1 hypothetical protein HL653_23390 [Sphingomonas sp. AP4-R1]
MTVLDQVRALIERLSPAPVCDDCINDRLDLSRCERADHKSQELAGTAGFERRIDACALCGATTKVTRAKVR